MPTIIEKFDNILQLLFLKMEEKIETTCKSCMKDLLGLAGLVRYLLSKDEVIGYLETVIPTIEYWGDLTAKILKEDNDE